MNGDFAINCHYWCMIILHDELNDKLCQSDRFYDELYPSLNLSKYDFCGDFASFYLLCHTRLFCCVYVLCGLFGSSKCTAYDDEICSAERVTKCFIHDSHNWRIHGDSDECVSITISPSIDRHVNKLWLFLIFLDCVGLQQWFRFKLVAIIISYMYLNFINVSRSNVKQ